VGGGGEPGRSGVKVSFDDTHSNNGIDEQAFLKPSPWRATPDYVRPLPDSITLSGCLVILTAPCY